MAAQSAAEQHKAAGNDAYKSGNLRSAAEEYTAAIAAAPSPIYYCNRAAAWMGLGQFSDALADAQEALALEQDCKRAHERRSRVFLKLGLLQCAQKALADGGITAPVDGAAPVAGALLAAVKVLPTNVFALPSGLLPPTSSGSSATSKALDASAAALGVAPHSPALLTAHAALLAATGRLATAAQYAAKGCAVVRGNAALWAAGGALAGGAVPISPPGGVTLPEERLRLLWDLHHPAAPFTVLALLLTAAGQLAGAGAAAAALAEVAAWAPDATDGGAPAAAGSGGGTGGCAPLHAWGVDAAALATAVAAAESAKAAANGTFKGGDFAGALEEYEAASAAAAAALGVVPSTLQTNTAAAGAASGQGGKAAGLRAARAALRACPFNGKAWQRAATCAGSGKAGGKPVAVAALGAAQLLAPTSVEVSDQLAPLRAATAHEPVAHITSEEAWGTLVAQARAAGTRRILVDYFATWCGPCKAIAPFVATLATAYHPSVLTFAKVDGDACGDLVMEAGVRAFPTFHVYDVVTGAKVDELQGASQGELQKLAFRAVAGLAAAPAAGPLAALPQPEVEGAAATLALGPACTTWLTTAAGVEGTVPLQALQAAVDALGSV